MNLHFDNINFKNTVFRYEDSFEIGPINLKIEKNECIIIQGGNGSGKSTFLKLLTYLYYPESGHIRINNKIVNNNNLQLYRELFSAVFSDFHLFKKLYGSSNIDDKKIDELLELFELDNKTIFSDNSFSNLNLSQGQKKRLALLISLVEDREILVFDEVAADQDPSFKKYFYETLIKDLIKKGKTIINASHDDQYFHTADRTLKMEFGNFILDD